MYYNRKSKTHFSLQIYLSILRVSQFSPGKILKGSQAFQYIYGDQKLKVWWSARRKENFSQMHSDSNDTVSSTL